MPTEEEIIKYMGTIDNLIKRGKNKKAKGLVLKAGRIFIKDSALGYVSIAVNSKISAAEKIADYCGNPLILKEYQATN